MPKAIFCKNRKIDGKIGKVVTKTFKKNKLGGYKKLRTRAADGYTGVSSNKILSITSNDERFKKFTAVSTNKAEFNRNLIGKKLRLNWCIIYKTVSFSCR